MMIVTKMNSLLIKYLFNMYDTIRYDSVYLTCSKKLTGSQLSLPHGVVHLFNKIVQQNQSGALTNSIRTVIRTGAAEPVQCAVRTDTAVKRRDVIIP